MEPIILLLGKNLDTLEILKDELIKFNRKIVYANSEEQIMSHLKNRKIDITIVGAGLPTEIKDELVGVVKKIAPDINVHIMERTTGITPASMIGYTNEKAVMWRLINARKNG